jgi:hypothetical protein
MENDPVIGPFGDKRNVSRLEAYLEEKITLLKPCDSMGVEHEIFLCMPDKTPATEELSQAVLRSLANDRFRLLDSEYPGFILGVKADDHGTFPTRIAYDLPPHLLEISTAPHHSLQGLQHNLRGAWHQLIAAAARCGARVESVPLVGVGPADTRLLTPRGKWNDLRYYRRKLLGAGNTQFENYAAAIASTQIHVALPATQYPAVVEKLYRLEPEILPVTAAWAGMNPSQLRQRWEGYAAVFASSPLIGFPHLESWSIENWLAAFCLAPMAGGPCDAWAARNLQQTGFFPRDSIQSFWYAARDLQIIRPRLMGTIEFRADPAMPTLEAVTRVAALRLGLCLAVLNGYEPRMSFLEAHDEWWRIARGGHAGHDTTDVVSLAMDALKRRAKHEERYLMPSNSDV